MATQCRSTGVQRPTDILLLMSNRHTHSCRHCRHLPTHRTIVHDTWMWMWFDALSAFAYRAIGASQPTTLRSAAFYVSFSSTLCPLPCTLESCLMSFGLTNININGLVCVCWCWCWIYTIFQIELNEPIIEQSVCDITIIFITLSHYDWFHAFHVSHENNCHKSTLHFLMHSVVKKILHRNSMLCERNKNES